MAWAGDWDRRYELSVDALVERGPFRVLWPTSVSWYTATVSCRGTPDVKERFIGFILGSERECRSDQCMQS